MSGTGLYAGFNVRVYHARHRIHGNGGSRQRKDTPMLIGMIVLGVVAFVAMLGFVALCERV
jgi:hypothetical protein